MESKPTIGTIVVVAKCPMTGHSKTRLIPLLGAGGAASLAEAMLKDVLESILQAELGLHKVLLYAPPTAEGKSKMKSILNELGLHDWTLMPMQSSDLHSSHLGKPLTNALHCVRELHPGSGPVIFIGMDAPELPFDELEAAVATPDTALLCPASDGGYGLLSVPASANADRVFNNVLWSHPLTALSQLKALTDAQVPIKLGRIMYDMDEPKDVHAFCQRQKQHHPHEPPAPMPDNSLLRSSNSAACTTTTRRTGSCRHTLQFLTDEALL